MYNPEKQARAAGGRFGGKVEPAKQFSDPAPGTFILVDDPDAVGQSVLATAFFAVAVLAIVAGLIAAAGKLL